MVSFWWSWRAVNPRPIGNKSGDYRLRPFKLYKPVHKNGQKRTGLSPGSLS